MQAARGTSLSDGEPQPDPPGSTTGASTAQLGPRRTLLFVLVVAAAYTADVATKLLAVERLSGGSDVPVLGEVLRLTLVRNPGAAFGLGTGYTMVISALSLVAAVVMVVLSVRLRDRIWSVGLGLALGGVLGNLTDRLLREPGPMRGHVIDFLRLPNWPVFNVADMCINVGIALIIVQLLRGIDRDGTREAV